jgi:hypothetical protein
LATQVAEDLACHEAFEAPDDFHFSLSFGRPSPNVVQGRLVAAHPDNAVESRVRLPVTAAVQPVPGGFSTRRRDRTGTAQFRKRRLRVDPLRIVAYQKQHLRRRARGNPVGFEHCRRALLRQLLEVAIMGFDLGIKHEPAPRDGP